MASADGTGTAAVVMGHNTLTNSGANTYVMPLMNFVFISANYAPPSQKIWSMILLMPVTTISLCVRPI